jgi:hypothetical protein
MRWTYGICCCSCSLAEEGAVGGERREEKVEKKGERRK